jgi:hypothetical protein
MAVTVTVYVPVLVLLATVIVSVDFPEVEIDAGLRLAVKPVGALADSVTVPVNPLRAVTVIVDVPERPLLMVSDAGEAEMEKSGVVTCTVRLTVWLSDPLVPVTVTKYVPLLALLGTVIVSVDWPDVVTEVGLRSAVQPVGAVAESPTVPVNPLRAVTVIVDVPKDPLGIVKVVGDVVSEKSGVAEAVKLMVTGLPKPVAKSKPGPAEYPFDPLVMSLKYEA